MRSFAFFCNAETFNNWRRKAQAGLTVSIDYVGFDNKRPFSGFLPGDELFIVGLRDDRVLLAGRMVVGTMPQSRADAVATTGRADFIDKPLICLSNPAALDEFRPDLTVPADIAKDLELFTSGGEPTDTASLRAGRPDPNLFRACPQLSATSAQQLRSLLGLEADADAHSEADGDAPPDGFDDDEHRLRAIKTRRGQHRFRQRLLDAYGRRCVITSCRVEALLEAAHITPHAALTDYNVSNGLLLRADIHTLFDLDLITVDEFCRVKVSEQLRHSEYWTYNDRRLDHFPDKFRDQPNRDALRARAARLKSATS